jgi:hypothetical protein
MKITKPKRASLSYTQHLVAEPSKVFPLLCPVLEADWIEGWDPISVITNSGVAEKDCVFVTSSSPNDAIWYITRHEPDNGFVEMLKITPLVTACKLSIQIQPTESGSDALVRYTHTSLGPEGDRFVDSFTEDFYRTFMQDWESRVNHYLLHGSALQSQSG